MDKQRSDPYGPTHPTQAGIQPSASSNIHCLCGYDLTAQTIGGTCPECGRLIALKNLTRQHIPVSGWAVASMILGIFSIPICVGVGTLSFLFGLLAVIFFFIARRKILRDEAKHSGGGMAIAGLISGALGMLLSLLCWFMVLIRQFR